jgi:hypothetical protein
MGENHETLFKCIKRLYPSEAPTSKIIQHQLEGGTNLQTEDTNLPMHHPAILISKLVLSLQFHLDIDFKMILTKLKTYKNKPMNRTDYDRLRKVNSLP